MIEADKRNGIRDANGSNRMPDANGSNRMPDANGSNRMLDADGNNGMPDTDSSKEMPDRSCGWEIRLKEHKFGSGKPVVCVPVVEKTGEGIVACVRDMVGKQAEMIEWRMDWFEECENPSAVERVLREIGKFVEKTVLLCTYRSLRQGGEGTLFGEAYLELNRAAARTKVPDLVDVEFYETEDPKKVIRQLAGMGVRVVASHHNFSQTPGIQEMAGQLIKMQEAGADFAKLAVMPQNKRDVLHLMEAVLLVKEQRPESHLIAMSMGSDGVISRLMGQWYASEVTFASFLKASAPGQVPMEAAAGLLEELGRWI